MNMMAPLSVAEPVLTRTQIAGLVALAARTVPPLWPLESAIAVNPLAGFEQLPFEQAVGLASTRFGARQSLPLAQWRQLLAAGKIDTHALQGAAIRQLGGAYSAQAVVCGRITRLDMLMARLVDLPAAAPAPPPPLTADAALLAKWCAVFFDQGRAAFAMPYRPLGLYRAVLAAIAHDSAYAALTGAQGQQLLLTVPRDPLEAIGEGLAALGIAAGEAEAVLAGLVARLPGWAGHIRWRSEQADPDIAAGAPAGMADLLALWLLLWRGGALAAASPPAPADASAALAAHFGLGAGALAACPPPARAHFAHIAAMTEDALGRLFQTAAEWGYANALVPQLERAAARLAAPPAPPAPSAPDAQLVFCIDVRSEPFRRALEAQGRIETLGYAGFFGLPIALHRHGEARRTRLLPVLLAPQHDVPESPAPGQGAQAAALAAGMARARQRKALFDAGKQGAATAFPTAEATGPIAGLLMAARTLAPRLVRRCQALLAPARHTAFAPALARHVGHEAQPVFTLEEKLGFARALFRLTGLTTPGARLVGLVGHGSSTVNNPYAAALDCGACGGNAGGANARLLAAILNEPEVRAALVPQGITIAPTTWFIAAQHDTTTDAVTLFDTHTVPASHSADLAALARALDRAGEANRSRRAALLGTTPADLLTGAMHWAEVRPEWGLSGNAAFVIGPRALSQAVDLDGRAFLHSYDWQADPDASALTTILTAPMVVGQWINCQYLFSTIDNHRYGSGDKVTQNIVGGIGVVQGNGGDLRVGLPWQSLFNDDGSPFHIPQRLLTIVYAPPERVAQVVEAHDILMRLFGNGWVTLVVIDPATGKARRWRRPHEADAPTPCPTETSL